MKLLSVLLILGMGPLPAESSNATIAYNVLGTQGPNLNGGPDCLRENQNGATQSASFDSNLSPTSTTSHSATYTLPAGSVIVSMGSITFRNPTPWTMKYTLTKTSDSVTLAGPGPQGLAITAVSSLKAGSFPKTVLGAGGHPAPLNSNAHLQNLTEPRSFLSYTGPGCAATQLGFTGEFSSNPPARP